MDSKWRNYGLWCSLAALLFMVLQDFGVNIIPERFDMYVNTIFPILLALGIISNPADGKYYVDTKKK